MFAIVTLVSPLGSFVNPSSDEDKDHLHPIFYPRILDATRKRIQEGILFDLHETLRCFQPFDATLPVDKVFGILGLVTKPDLVEVDYTLSSRDVYQKVALSTLRHTKNLDLFLDCLQNVAGPRIPGLPSWVPDWSTTDGPLDNAIPTVTSKEIFHASRGTQLDDTIQSVDGILKLRGQFIGKIADLGETIPSIGQLRMKYWPQGRLAPHRRAFEVTIDATRIFNSWKTTICRRHDDQDRLLSDKYPTGESLLEVLYHTTNSNGGPFSDAAADRDFTAWM